MIRVFSELDRKRRQRFGKRHLKEALASCHTKVVFLGSFLSIRVFFFSFYFLLSEFVLSLCSYCYFSIFFVFYIQVVFSNDAKRPNIMKSPAFVPVPQDFRENVHTKFVRSLRADVCLLLYFFLHPSIYWLGFFCYLIHYSSFFLFRS
jgi:hypothetical protein